MSSIFVYLSYSIKRFCNAENVKIGQRLHSSICVFTVRICHKFHFTTLSIIFLCDSIK